jgi:hypothetical protein
MLALHLQSHLYRKVLLEGRQFILKKSVLVHACYVHALYVFQISVAPKALRIEPILMQHFYFLRMSSGT